MKTKWFFCALLALVMVLVLLPTGLARAETDYSIDIDGTRVTSDNLSGDGWSYNPDNHTLTLENADIQDATTVLDSEANICINNPGLDLKIVLSGENHLRGGFCGILCNCNSLTIKGSGSLVSEGMINTYDGALTISDTSVTVEDNGISCGTLTINHSEVVCNGGENTGITAIDVTIEDSTVIAFGEIGLWCNGILSIDGNSTAELHGDNYAVWTRGNVRLNDQNSILYPADGTFDEYGTGKSVYTGTSELATTVVLGTLVTYPLWVGGEQVTNKNLSGEGWAFTPAEGQNPAVLELNNYRYTGAGSFVTLTDENNNTFSCAFAMLYEGDEPLLITVTGQNELNQTTTIATDYVGAIYSRCVASDALTILGMDDDASLSLSTGTTGKVSFGLTSKGALEVKALKLRVESGNAAQSSYAIYCNGFLRLDECDVTAISGNATDASEAISSVNAAVHILNGTVTATTGNADRCMAIHTFNGDILISGCEAKVTAGDATGGYSFASSYGISAGAGDIHISASTVEAASVKSNYRCDAIYASKDVVISSSNVTATGGEAGQFSYGVLALSGKLTISNSNVKATGGAVEKESGGLYANDGMLIDEDSTVEAIGVDTTSAKGVSAGIVCFRSTTIRGNSTVTAKAGAGQAESEAITTNDFALIVEDSTLTAECSAENGFGIVANKLNFSGASRVTAIGGANAICISEAPTLSDRILLTTPTGGTYADDGNGHLVLTGIDGTTPATRAVYEPGYRIWVGGVQVTDAALSGEGWAFTPAQGDDPAILELNNYHYEGEGTILDLRYEGETEAYLSAAAIFYDESAPLEVRLTGENVLTQVAEQSVHQSFGLYCRNAADDALTIIGTDEDASLTATCGSASVISVAIMSKGGMILRNAAVNAENTENENYSYGIRVDSTLLIEECAVQAKSGAASSTGNAIYANTDLTISGGSINATAGAAKYSTAINCQNGDVQISGSEIIAASSDATQDGYGLYSYSGSLTVSDSTLKCSSGANGDSSEAIYMGGDISFKDSDVTAIGGEGKYSFGVCSYDGAIAVHGSKIVAEGSAATKQSVGIEAWTGIVIDGQSTVTVTGREATGEDGASVGMSSFGPTSITDSAVTATAANSAESYGVCAYDWENGTDSGTLTVTNSKLVATGVDGAYGSGIYVNKLIAGGSSEITAKSGTTAGAIAADNEFELSDDLAVVTPFNGVYGRNGNSMVAVFADEETPAGTVVIKSAATVTFQNDDGTELQSGKVGIGDLPEYYGETPTKASTSRNEYTFEGWTPEIVPVDGEAVYTATFTEELLRPQFIGSKTVAYDAYITENGEMLYRFDVTVEDLIEGALAINSAQIFLTYDHDALMFVRGEGPLEWELYDVGEVLSAVWASDTETLLRNGDVLLTLYFAAKDVAPDTEVQIAFTENGLGSGSALSFVDEGVTTELVAYTTDGSILFDAVVYGDANNDGVITSADAALILRAVVGLSELTPRGALNADVDGDGEVTAADAVAILRWLVGLIEQLPVE